MNDVDNKTYEYIKKISNQLKDKYKIKINDIPKENIELSITINNGSDNVSIDFQKQNKSFILLINKKLDKIIVDDIIDRINKGTDLEIFATYQFVDINNYVIYHWIYGKKELNKNILNSFNSINQIKNLKFYNP